MAFEGRLAIIAGGIGGIGCAVGKLLRNEGASLALLYAPFEKDKVEAVVTSVYTADDLHSSISTYECDITQAASVQKAFEEIAKKNAAFPSILINSAGYVNLTPMVETPSEDILAHYMINLYGPTLTGQAFAKIYMAAKKDRHDGPGGRIVNIASQAAHVALDQHGAYCASKAGLLGLTKCQANEWGPYGITSNTISPGPVMTDLGKKAWGDDKVRSEYLKRVPTGALAEPEEVASVVLFLCQDISKSICGADISVDGGYTAL